MPYSLTFELTSHMLYVIIVVLLALWTGHYWVVRQIFRGTFLKFRVDLLKDINGTYVRTIVFNEYKTDTDRRLDRLEDNVLVPLVKKGIIGGSDLPDELIG